MKKGKYRLWAALWILAMIITRIVYFLYSGQSVTDTYGYYASAMIRADQTKPVLASGMAYAYTGNLSGVLSFLGNRMELIGIYQLVLQILWITLLFFGVGLLFGRIAQMLTGTILALSPWILGSIFVISPENYFMLFFSLILLLLGLFFVRTQTGILFHVFSRRVALMVIAFGMGVVCTWNYLGWLLILAAVYVIVKGKRIPDGQNPQKGQEDGWAKGRDMPLWTQVFALAEGLLLGIFATLLRYTGLTGLFVWEQLAWWSAPLLQRCQDLSIQMTVWLVFAVATGIVIAAIVDNAGKGRIHSPADGERRTPEGNTDIPEKKKEAPENGKDAGEEKLDDYIITEDGRKVAYLENPLPLPKKHEKKKMEFKYNELPKASRGGMKEWDDHVAGGGGADDFDVAIPENDDFDV